MGKTRRHPRPPLHHIDLKEETLDRLHNLKIHRDEPIYEVADRSSKSLELLPIVIEERDECRKNIGSLQPIITSNGTAMEGMLEYALEKGIIFPTTLECFKNDVRKHIETFYNKKKQLPIISN